jgi:hypothetical protein
MTPPSTGSPWGFLADHGATPCVKLDAESDQQLWHAKTAPTQLVWFRTDCSHANVKSDNFKRTYKMHPAMLGGRPAKVGDFADNITGLAASRSQAAVMYCYRFNGGADDCLLQT